MTMTLPSQESVPGDAIADLKASLGEGELDAWVNINSDEGESCAASEWNSPTSTPRASQPQPSSDADPPEEDKLPSKPSYAAAVKHPSINLENEYFPAELTSVQDLGKDRTYKVTLKSLAEHTKALSMYVGETEGKALLQMVNGQAWNKQGCRRPMTYDFMHAALEAIGRQVTFVRICRSERGVFYARTHFVCAEGGAADAATAEGVDCRPSDALNLAVRCGAPIHVHKKLMAE